MKASIHVLTLFKGNRFFLIALVPLLTMCQPATEKVSGRYEATLPDTNPGRILQLELGEDQTASLSTNFLNEKTTILQKGSWERNNKDRLTVYFVDTNGQMALDTLKFDIKGSQLKLSAKRYGSQSITLMRRIQ